MNGSRPLELLLGTANRAKTVEIRRALRDLDIHFKTLQDLNYSKTVNESGATYEANARLKAEAYSRQSGLWTLADDSGLEVDALDGAPGIFSARFAGIAASDRDRISVLLEQLGGDQQSAARFVSVVALSNPAAQVVKVECGICEGTIIDSPRGENGFGYDPIFIPLGFNATFGELASETKDDISHRGKALRAMHTFLAQLIAQDRSLKLDQQYFNS
jgi:XTP/dITP diphosphohydrolase